jgi:glycerol-3-phosphate dehydrogenase
MMKRNIASLDGVEFDLIVIGGGIFGICAAWDAALRGISVVLLEKGDFAQATSSNHFKMVHSGIRYLQHLDLYRIFESSNERSVLLNIVPHLVHNIPVIIPTYGHGLKGKEILGMGLTLYDLLTMNKNNRISDPSKKVKNSKILSRKEVLSHFPALEDNGLTGGALFEEGQMYNPTRLPISFLRSCAARGVHAVNYCRVTGFTKKGNRVNGVTAKDMLSGDTIEVRGKVVLNSAGPWASELIKEGLGERISPEPVFSRDLAFVIRQSLSDNYGIACQIKSSDKDAVISRGGRHLFLMPWRGNTLIGVWHSVYRGDKDSIEVGEEEIENIIRETNEGYPALKIKREDVSMVNTGLTLFSSDNRENSKLSFGKRSRIVDHGRTHKIDGIVTLIGVRATTARIMAEKVMHLILGKLGRGGPPSRTSIIPLYGGNIGNFKEFSRKAEEALGEKIPKDIAKALVYNYGDKYRNIIAYMENISLKDRLGDSTVTGAEVVHGVREEMAEKLCDVVFRRTDMGTAGNPGERAITKAAGIMAREKGWSKERMEKEIGEVNEQFFERGWIKRY